MTISVIDPVSPAIERTKLVLFQPFDLGKWFKLGFCAFLATLGDDHLARSTYATTCPAYDCSILASLAFKGAALGHEL